MCRGVAWLELTAMVPLGEECRRRAHGFLGSYLMKEKIITSCGGVIIYRGKALILYYKNKRDNGWILPKGKLEQKESYRQAAIREVQEEASVKAQILKSLGKTQYNFRHGSQLFSKTVHWFLMSSVSFYCKPQIEENFADVGYYKQHEAYHLLKYQDEKEILCRAFNEYRHFKMKS